MAVSVQAIGTGNRATGLASNLAVTATCNASTSGSKTVAGWLIPRTPDVEEVR